MKEIAMKLLIVSIINAMMLAGCAEDNQTDNKNMVTASMTPTILCTPMITPTPNITSIVTENPTIAPVSTIVPTPYYEYPNDYYDVDALNNLTNYRFNSVSGVNEKKLEDFDTIEEFEKHIKTECYNKYVRLKDYVSRNRNNIDALYIHCFLYINDGYNIEGKMDVVVTDPFVIQEWIFAVLDFEIKEEESFGLKGTNCGVGTDLLYCIEVDGEIVEFFANSNMSLVYTQEYINRVPYSGDQINDRFHYNCLDYVNRQILDAVHKRYLQIYKDPINYPYILD